MKQKRPILIWRLKNMPSEIKEMLVKDGFYGNRESYRLWQKSKTGNEFIVLIPDHYVHDDLGVDIDLGIINEPEERAERETKHEFFLDLYERTTDPKMREGYYAYIIPSLKEREDALLTKSAKE